MTEIGDIINGLDITDESIRFTYEEALCLDYVLTSPSWDSETIRHLDEPHWWNIRRLPCLPAFSRQWLVSWRL